MLSIQADPWQKEQQEADTAKQAAAAVSIQKIFRGYVDRKVYLKLRREYREAQENKKLSAITIQRYCKEQHCWNLRFLCLP